jgi:hypothetical protein
VSGEDLKPMPPANLRRDILTTTTVTVLQRVILVVSVFVFYLGFSTIIALYLSLYIQHAIHTDALAIMSVICSPILVVSTFYLRQTTIVPRFVANLPDVQLMYAASLMNGYRRWHWWFSFSIMHGSLLQICIGLLLYGLSGSWAFASCFICLVIVLLVSVVRYATPVYGLASLAFSLQLYTTVRENIREHVEH